jgi:arylsulfatase A
MLFNKSISQLTIPVTALSFMAIATGCETNTQKQEAPNIILIMADDLGYECLGIYGSEQYNTPVLDRLAEQGMYASHCIAQPLCTPSRVKIMTGMYNYRNYYAFDYLHPDSYTFGNLMKEAGYTTAIAGKWQLNGVSYQKPGWDDMDRPHHFGFDEYCLWQVTRPKQEGERYSEPLIYKNGKKMAGLEKSYGPDVFRDFSLDFIEQNKDRPFFLYYPMVLPHDPFVPTPASDTWESSIGKYEQDTTYYRDMVEYIDLIVGSIDQKLHELGIRDNTLLIFTSDNGTPTEIFSMTPSGLLQGEKGILSEMGTRVPLIISWPGVIKKTIAHRGLVEFTDFFATFAELVNVNKPSDGISLLPLLKGETTTHRETAFLHYNPNWFHFQPGRFIRTLDYKLYDDGRFFEMKSDSLQRNPLDVSNLNEEQYRNYIFLKEELASHPPGDVAGQN